MILAQLLQQRDNFCCFLLAQHGQLQGQLLVPATNPGLPALAVKRSSVLWSGLARRSCSARSRAIAWTVCSMWVGARVIPIFTVGSASPDQRLDVAPAAMLIGASGGAQFGW
jgi:hypothetical protein